VKIARTTGLAALLLAGALTMAACGSDNNSATTTTPAAGTTSATTSAASVESSGAASSDSSSADTGSAATGSSDTGSSAAAGGGATTFEGAGFTCATGSLASSGSTAQGKAISKWIIDYNAKCGATIADYGGGGSGKGVSDFIAKQTDFGGSDSALKDDQPAQAKERCGGNAAIDLPMVTGPVAMAYNLDGVDKLILTPELLTGIFGGTITTWNDPKIAAVNPGVTLPSVAIATVHRAEESGTTDNFTKYLTAAGGWTFEGGKAWTAPGGTAAQGNDGVGKAVAGTAGSIGYVEWGYAKDNNLHMAQIDNGGGAVELTAESAAKAIGAAKVVGTDGDLSLEIDFATKEPGAYPIVLVTYEIVCSAGNGDKAALLKSFLGYTSTDGQGTLDSVGAAPLPAEIQAKVIKAVQDLS